MKILVVFAILIASFFSKAQSYVVSTTYMDNIDVSVLSAIAGEPLDYSVNLYKMIYNTVDVHGLPIVASGAIALPANAPCSEYPIAIYEHGSR